MSRMFVSPPTRSAASREPPRVAVIGTGASGAACAAALLEAGLDVTAFDKSRGVGGRMATRRRDVAADEGAVQVAFDHGCGPFTATGSRFAAAVDRVVAQDGARRWRQRVYGEFPSARERDVVSPTPDMPAFCRHLLAGVPLRLGHAVTALDRLADGWRLRFADQADEGPFDQVVLAIPAAQAATLLAGHADDWRDALDAVPMAPCWTLLAVTDDIDWPWDAAALDRGVLDWISRGDRAPGRTPARGVPWVAHANAAWSLDHLEDDPAQVCEALQGALGRWLGGVPGLRWQHAEVHRWRYARCLHTAPDATARRYLLDPGARLALCGDAFGDGVEAAWQSGDALAGAIAASFRPAAAESRPSHDAAVVVAAPRVGRHPGAHESPPPRARLDAPSPP